MKNLIILAGPTGSGKTDIACGLDHELFEVVSFDSRQIYREMAIGTAAPTAEEKSKIFHHLTEIILPDEKLNAASFAVLAEKAVNDIYSRNKIPLLVCGTGFYLRAFLYGMYPVPEISPAVRLKVESYSKSERADLLAELDSEAMAVLFPNDDYRISRALEVNLSGAKWSALKDSPPSGFLTGKDLDVTGILLAPDRENLYKRLNLRADLMLKNGLIEETRLLVKKYGEDCQGLKTLGYNFALEIISGKISLETGYENLAQSHRNYAKKQITWFKKETLLTSHSTGTAMIQLKKIEKRFKNVG